MNRQDIESLGFKDHNGNSYIHEENDIIGFLVWNGKDEYMIKYDKVNQIIKSIVHTAGLYQMFNCFFSINVNNKDELKKILIQFNILQ